MKPTFALLVLLTLGATAAHAASPSLTGVRPLGGQRGTELEVKLTGARLGDAKESCSIEPGITMSKLQVVNDGHVKATLKIAADARSGCTISGSGRPPGSASCARSASVP